MHIKRWTVSKPDKERVLRLAQEAELPMFLAMMLDIRGIRTPSEARRFLGTEESASDPFLLPDMDRAVSRLQRALNEGERIAVYGDYDADGITATAILYSYLETCGGDVLWYIPQREGEGYGLNRPAVKTLAAKGVKLIVTVDNGIASAEETELAKRLGMDVIVTDHHRPQGELPAACAVVDAWREDSKAPFRDFAGAGVAYELLLAMEGEDGAPYVKENYADLAAIGTIGDVVPMLGENRALAREGLAVLNQMEKPGIRALLRQSSMEGKTLTAAAVSYSIVPRVNAAGRVDTPETALRLMLSGEEEAERLAAEVSGNNEARRECEGEIFQLVQQRLREQPALYHDRVLVIDGTGWRRGVIGIVAARTAEKFGKPCVILSTEGGETKGSGRSIGDFSLFSAISACSDLLIRFGGHTMAAGVTLKPEKIEAFRKRINEYAASLPEPVSELRIDCRLKPGSLTPELPELLKGMEPFGEGNPAPLFGLFGMRIRELTPVGNGRYLRMLLEREGSSVSCVHFGMSAETCPFRPGDAVDAAVTLERQEYRGKPTLSVAIRDLRPAGFDAEAALRDWHAYEKLRRGEALSGEEALALLPRREDLAAIYRYLKAAGGFSGSPLDLMVRSGVKTLGKVLTGTDVLFEGKVIELESDTVQYRIALRHLYGKSDLSVTRTLSCLSKEVSGQGENK